MALSGRSVYKTIKQKHLNYSNRVRGATGGLPGICLRRGINKEETGCASRDYSHDVGGAGVVFFRESLESGEPAGMILERAFWRSAISLFPVQLPRGYRGIKDASTALSVRGT